MRGCWKARVVSEVGRRALYLFSVQSHGLCHSLVFRTHDGGYCDVDDDRRPNRAMSLAVVAVLRELKPRWQPSWPEFKRSWSYGMRDYAGVLADYTTLRVDQLMLGAMATNAAVGLYVVAVRLSR